MADRGGFRGRSRDGGGRRGRGDYRGGPPGGRGGDGGGRGYGGRGGESGGRGGGDFRGRGRGDFGGRGGGRGDFGGRRGGGGGRGRGFFGGPIQPLRDAEEGTAARPGKRLPMITNEQAAENFNKFVSSINPDILKETAQRPRRPGYGKAGKPTQVQANHFAVKCTLQQAAHYDVEIQGARRQEDAPGRSSRPARPEKPLPSSMLREVMQALAKQERWAPGDWVYDGRKNVYSPRKFLPQQAEFQVAVQEEGRARPRNFTVAINYVASVNVMQLLNAVKAGSGLDIPQDAIQALDVALKQSASTNALCTTVSRNFFFEGSGTTVISGGAEVWLGYKQSLRPCENGLTLNIDVAATAFLSPVPVLQFLSSVLRRREDLLTLEDRNDLRKAQKAISGLRVTGTHGNTKRTYKVKGIKADGGAAGTIFMNEQEGREMSVAEYFEHQYKLKLKYPHHPLLNVGSPSKVVYLPIEVCKLASGQRQLKLDARQTADMIKITAQRPDDRSRRIMKALTQDSKLPTDQVVRTFGMQVSPNMELVNARVLQAPALKYASEFGVPSEGSWNLRNARFHAPATIDSYGVVSFLSERDVGSPGPEGFPAFVAALLRKLQELGLRTPDPNSIPTIIYHDGRNKFPGESMVEAAKAGNQHFRNPPRIIFVLLPDNSANNGYTEVKRASDSFLGIPSQCFAANKAKIGERDPRGREQYLANVGMKVNAKLNGTNVVLSRNPSPWMDKPYIVFGADVTHSRGFDASEPSVAAVVGSLNASCTRYSAEVKMQGHRVEMIQDLKGIIKKLLITFYQQAGKRKPERIIFYRDGVSEGQFPEVQRVEIPQIIAGCSELGMQAGEDYSPPVTFVVAQKRHNTRFFPTREADRSGNVLPGLVVDTKVVHPTDFSFYLNSHAGLQGTSRPCHYHVLLDQNKFPADELQIFTNSLCYLYCRCSKSVSIVIPAYYAHLAAFRGRAMLAHSASSSDSESTVSGTSGRATHFAEFASIHQNLKNVMFYV